MENTKVAVWQQWDGFGLEYLEWLETDSKFTVESTVIAVEAKLPFKLVYSLRCDKHYQVERIVIRLPEHPSIRMSQRNGQWFDANKHPLSEFDGCHDIDISATPFTNTLPIKRLDWQIGQTRSLDMVYIRIPELTIERATQQYTCLEKNEQGSLFEYSQPGFSAILPIDADGFVQNYPKLFRRLS